MGNQKCHNLRINHGLDNLIILILEVQLRGGLDDFVVQAKRVNGVWVEFLPECVKRLVNIRITIRQNKLNTRKVVTTKQCWHGRPPNPSKNPATFRR